MRTIKTEVVLHMSGLETSDRTVTARFRFPEEFIGFQGHFPGKKVLPGVCEIQCALSLVEQAKQKSAELKEIVLAKYFAPVSPDEEILCTVSDVAENGECTIKAAITKGATKVAELKLKVALR